MVAGWGYCNEMSLPKPERTYCLWDPNRPSHLKSDYLRRCNSQEDLSWPPKSGHCSIRNSLPYKETCIADEGIWRCSSQGASSSCFYFFLFRPFIELAVNQSQALEAWQEFALYKEEWLPGIPAIPTLPSFHFSQKHALPIQFVLSRLVTYI